jgi:hypothetical protein
MIRGIHRVSGWRLAFLLVSALALATGAMAQAPATPQAKAVGEIKSLSGGALVLSTDDGKKLSVSLSEGVKVVRIAPGATDLKNATVITVADLQVGDRVLVRGKASDDGKSLAAAAVIVMKQSDVSAKKQQEQEDWQKRGTGGLVSEVDPAAGTVTISVTSFSGTKKILIKTNKKTVVRRYAPDSIRFDDAKPSTLASIHPGDQLRARGNKNEEGTEFAAEEIVAGTFRNIAGTVTSVNAADNSMVVMDLLTKKPVTVKVTPDTQMRKLPVAFAQRIAMRLKGQAGANGAGAASGGAPPGAPAGAPGGQSQGGAPQVAAGGPGGYGGGSARSGGGDLQQILTRTPAMTLTEFQKGDAVILVSTEGDASGVTAITVVAGVEPILTASPGAQGMTLSPWSLGGGQADAQ